ncbi:MAG: amidohydrolase family protein [Gammaproteobacteria bacterium]|nr:amidohydrolase family protein [Gammaproteobacteria bacterium]
MSRKLEGSPPSTILPVGSIDSHVHVYSQDYPSQGNGLPLPADFANYAMYQRLQQWLGIDRAVLVQPNAYQTDNRCLLDVQEQMGNNARTIVAIKPGCSEKTLQELHDQGVRGVRIMQLLGGAVGSEKTLQELHDQGVRGVRIMQLLGGAVGMEELLAVNQMVAPLNWSCIVQFDGREMLSYVPMLEKLIGNYVIDHAGKYLEPVSVNDPTFTAFLKLLDRGNCYTKLAGCYETSKSGAPNYEDVAVLSKALALHAPERMLWGSNWPHVSLPPEQSPDDSKLLDSVCGWMHNDQLIKKMFVENPVELYGFDQPI